MDQFDKNAVSIKKTLKMGKGVLDLSQKEEKEKGLLSASQIRQNILSDMKTAIRQADSLRKGGKESRPVDISFGKYVKMKFGFEDLNNFYATLGIDPAYHTLESLSSMPEFDEGYSWLRPEIIREAIRLGLRRTPIYNTLIGGKEESVSQKKVTLPQINASNATPSKIGEAETIGVGTLSFDEKDVSLFKIGTGIKVSDEVQKYVSLNIISLYLQDVGVQLGLGLDTMAIDVLVNGDGGNPNYGAPVIGVDNTSNGITYKDILRMWLRMGRLGRMPSGLISAEDPALKILLMDEFKKWSPNNVNAKHDLKIKTPIPQSQDYLVHGAMPNSEILGFIDTTSALMKLNASGLLVESERIAEKQLNGTYVTQTTGFAKLFRDAFVLLDGTQAFSTAGFPDWMDVSGAEKIIIS